MEKTNRYTKCADGYLEHENVAEGKAFIPIALDIKKPAFLISSCL